MTKRRKRRARGGQKNPAKNAPAAASRPEPQKRPVRDGVGAAPTKRSGKKLSRLRGMLASDRFAVLMLALFALFFFSALIAVDRVFYGSDLVFSFYFYTDFTYRMLRELTVPFWNPYVFSGTPYFPSAGGIYYPLHYLFLALPTPLAMNLNLVLHFFLAGAFTYGFLRRIGQDRTPAFIGSLVFMFPLIEILHLYGGHIPRLEARVWIPFVFWMYHGFHTTRRLKYLVLGALGIGLAVLVGHLQIIFYMLFCLALYGLFLLSVPNDLSRLRNLSRFTLFVGLGVATAAVQLLPMIHWSGTTGRAQSYEFATSFSLPPLSLATAVVPFAFGDKIDGFYYGPSIFWEACLFVGLPAVLLSAAALYLDRERRTWFFFGMLALTLVVALGRHTPLYKLFYTAVPGYSFFRVPGRILTVFVFFAAVLTSLGASALLGRDVTASKQRHRYFAFPAALLALLFVLVAFFAFTEPSGEAFRGMVESIMAGMRRPPKDLAAAAAGMAVRAHGFVSHQVLLSAAAVAATGGLLWLGVRRRIPRGGVLAGLTLIVFAEQYTHGRRYLSTLPEEHFDWEDAIEALIDARRLRSDAEDADLYRVMDSRTTGNLDKGMRYNVSSVNGYEGGILKRYNEFVNVARRKPKDKYYAVLKFGRYHPMLDILNVRYRFDTPRSAGRSELFRTVYRDRGLVISERTDPIARAWVVHEAVVERDADTILERLYRRTVDPRRTVLLEDSDAKELPSAGGSADDEVTITGYGPNRITLEAALEREGYLVLSEVDAPGWEAVVDGEPVEIRRADYLLRAVHLEAGEHAVELRFRPPLFAAGAVISLLALLALAGLLVWERRLHYRGLHRRCTGATDILRRE